MQPGSLLPVLGLSLAGLLLAGGAALALGSMARRGVGATWTPLIAAGAIGLACLLPFVWIALFGSGR